MPDVPVDLEAHEPSDTARLRAEAAGLNLERLKREAPDEYRMLNAEAFVRVSPELVEAARNLLPDDATRHVYRVPGHPAERLLAFPPLTPEEQERFDEAAAHLVASDAYRDHLAFFRTVRDPHGERRELMLPITPDAWNGEVALVGPFDTQADAEAWPAGRLPPHLLADPLPYLGHWFCDVFDGEDAWVEARASNEAPS